MKSIRRFLIVVLLLSALAPLMSRAASPDATSDRQEIDSLLNILPYSHSTEKIDVLINLSKKYMSFSLESSGEYAKLALANAKIIDDKRYTAESYKLLGNISYYQGNNTKILHYYDSCLQIYSLLSDSIGLAKIWNNKGVVYNNIGLIEKSIEFHKKSLEYKIILNDSSGIAASYNNIGAIYYELSNFEKSHQYFHKAMKIFEQTYDLKSVQSALNNLGLVNHEMGDYENSLEFYFKSLKIGKNINNKHGMADTYHNIGKTKYAQGLYQESLDYYFKAHEIQNGIGIESSTTLNNIGQLYIKLDYYNKALYYLKKALTIAKDYNQFNDLRDIYNNLSVLYEYQGRFDKAYYHYILYNQYDDSINSQAFTNEIEDIQEIYEIEQEQTKLEKISIQSKLDLEIKDAQIRRRNFSLYVFSAGFLAIIVVLIILIRLIKEKNAANDVLKKQKAEAQKSEKVIKRINKALKDNEEMLRSVFEASPFAITVVDPNGTIIDCNKASIEMFNGDSKRDIINKKFYEFISPEQHQLVTGNFQKAIAKEPIEDNKYLIVRKDGSTFKAESFGGMIYDNFGKPKAYVSIIVDVNEREEFVENLKHAKVKAEESDKLKTAFLANMSHEIRTPMNAIIGFANLLTATDLGPDKKNEYLTHIIQSSNLLLNLIDDIIDISKIESGQLTSNIQECKIDPFLKELYNSYEESNDNKKLSYKLSLPADGELYTFNTDVFRLKQIVSNLVGNAKKFTSKGSIEFGYEIKEEGTDTILEFFVKDTGIGISKDKFEMIFERFRQIDDSSSRKFGGTGLGLAISKKLVEMLDGEIWLESEVDKGTIFYFTIPFSSVKKDIPKKQEVILKGGKWEDKTILIAEDENSNYEMLKASLSKTSAKVIRAINGEVAVEIVSNTTVDLVLMDIRMPKMNGYEATQEIKIIDKNIPVVAITAYAMSEDEAKSIDAGCDKYVPKPIRPSKLLSLIEEFLGP